MHWSLVSNGTGDKYPSCNDEKGMAAYLRQKNIYNYFHIIIIIVFIIVSVFTKLQTAFLHLIVILYMWRN